MVEKLDREEIKNMLPTSISQISGPEEPFKTLKLV